MSAQIQALRDQLARRFPGAQPLAHARAPVAETGIPAIDGILPHGGLPRGRITAWTPGPGAQAVLRSAARAAAAQGERCVWIDARGTAGDEVWRSGSILARPDTELQALECAEELARSGAFALVVLSGAASADAARVRLSRAVREGGSALVELSAEGFLAGVRVTSRIVPRALRWRADALGERIDVEAVPVQVRAAALGWSQEATVFLPISRDVPRLSLESALADRRGAAR